MKRTRTKILSVFLSFCMIISCMVGMSVTAYAASASYVDGSGTSQTVDATELAANTTSWTNGSWYIVPESGLTISGRITVNGTVNLILRDGATLTASAGITTTNATLNIYAQSAGTGALIATGSNGDNHSGGGAGIGGGGGANGGAGGNVNIYGGTVTATGGNGGEHSGCGAGIGGGGAGDEKNGGTGGNVNIYGGMVTATGDNGYQYFCGGGAGIGGGGGGDIANGGAGGTVNIYGGTVTSKGGNSREGGDANGAGIGGGGKGGEDGSAGTSGTLTLGKGVKLYNGTNNSGTVLDDSDITERSYSGSRSQNMFAEFISAGSATVEKSVTFTANGTQDGITVSNKMYSNGGGYFQVNKNSNLTISSGSGNITKLEITDAGVRSGTFTESHIVVTPGTKSIRGKILTVTDINAKSVTLSATDSKYWYAKKIVVYYEGVTGPDKTALNDAITAAETLYNSINGTNDYSDIASTLEAAINAAKTVANSEEADQDAINTAATDIINAKINAVIGVINTLPTTVTTADKDKIEAARTVYDLLDDTDKTSVTNSDKLTAAEEALVTAQNKADFDAYKNEQKTAAENKKLTGDSAAATKLITDAKNAIDALTYDTSKTLDENKEAVTEKVTQLTTDLTDQRAADAVIEKINALPTTVTTANKADIEAARAAYDALTPAQKAKVGDTAKAVLETAETALVTAQNKAAFDAYKTEQKTAAENKAQTGDSDEAKALITAAKAAIDALEYDPNKTLDQNKTAVTAVVTQLTTDLTDQRAADAVIEKINALPESTDITSANKDDIEAARAAYNALTPAQKDRVPSDKLQELTGAETALSEAQVNETSEKINDLPDADKVTASDKEDIEAAREAYDALTPDQKAQAGDEAKEKLEAAEAALAIAELPSADAVTSSDKTAIEAARAKYDALTDAQKSQVGDAAKEKLEAAEAALAIAELPAASDVTTTDKTAIEKARAAYDALTDTQKAQVGDTLKEKLEAAEVALTKKLIEAIPDPADVTTADADKVAAAKTVYDKLTDDQKAKITEAEKEKLDAAAQALSDAETSDVEALIKALPSTSSVTTADAEAIEAAKEAFDELTEAQKAIVKSTLKDKLAADLAALAIAKLPAADNVTAADKDAIEAARAAYDALTSTQKSSVGEAAKAKLEAAEAKIQDAVDTEAAKAVIDKINALPASTAVTAENKNAIEEAREAYDALTDDQKAKIDTDTLKKLTDAEAAIQDAEDKAAADAVNATIDALPGADDVTVSDKAAIEAAREAYDALTDEQKAKVSADTLKKLTDAEDALALAESEDKLDKTISSATAYYDSIKNRYPAIAGTLKNAIDAAQAVIDDENAEKADIDAAVTALNKAVSTARTAVSYAGGGSSTPSYVPSYSPSNTSTTTTTTTTSSSVDSASSKAKMWAVQNDDKSSITVGWEKVNGATLYTLYVRKNGKLEKVVDTKKTKVLIKNPANNTNLEYVLKYTIGGVESAESSAYTASIKVYYKPAVKATSKNGAVTLKWNKVPEATKYRVYKYVNGKLVKVADTTANAVRLKNVTTGKTYKYAVKAYVDGKWTKVTKSDIVSVKVK